MVKTENRYFDVFPKVVPADRTTTIKIRPLFNHCRFREDAVYEVCYFPIERFSRTGEYRYQENLKLKPVDGILHIEQYFKGEQEHIFEINEILDGKCNKTTTFSVYSLEEDLFSRKPYKGDLHMHSYYSDGKESPAFVTASCRKIGLDFMALTDHGRYSPSIESQEVFKGVDLDLLICRGEEVHPPHNPVHMINFGGSFSVNELIKDDEDKYLKEVKEIEKTLKEIEDEDACYQCASSTWCFDKIRQGGGLGIFCHPYWLVREGNYISDTVISYMHKKQPYDADELIGGYFKNQIDSNTLEVARYHEERAKGKKIPIVGVSDAHGCENSDLFGWYYTIVFTPTNEQSDIISSIKDLYSVAVEAITGECVRAYGPFRLVKYALFLLREVLPHHDEMCFEEGQLMMKYISGEDSAAERLKYLKGQTEKLYDKLWG